jgi:hypothetical protein
MHGLTFAFTLISALGPASAGASAEAGSHGQTLTIAQVTSPPPQGAVEVAPPPPPPTAVAPAEGYAPPPPMVAAPAHRGLSLWGVVPYYYGGFGVGLGARFAIPLPIPSLIRGGRVHDNWAIEFGADYLRLSDSCLGCSDISVNWFMPVVGFMWNVWLTDRFAVYPKAEAGYRVAWVSGLPDGVSSTGYGGIWADGAVGLIYMLGGNVNLRAEVGNIGLKGGVGFSF